MEMVVNNDGSDIFIKFPPPCTHTTPYTVPNFDPDLFQNKSLFKDKVVIPVKLKSQEEEHKINFHIKNMFNS
jgi:hypothetical protein